MDRMVGIFGLLFAVVIAVRIILVYRKTGVLPLILRSNDEAHDFVHSVLAIIIALQALNIIAFRLQALRDTNLGLPLYQLYSFLGPLPALHGPAYQAFGLGLAFGGLLWSVIGQQQMGKEWRIGFAKAHDKTELVTHGLYARSRHPIYSGFILIAWGLFLATPNILTLILAVLTIVILAIEARLEEAYLLSLHGEPYREYLSRTRRWM